MESSLSWGSAPNPVLAGGQPVCHNRPGNKRMNSKLEIKGQDELAYARP